jgi:hypothetical protein
LPSVIVGFVGGTDRIDGLIETVTDALKENISHTFLIISNDLYESTGCKEDGDPYAGVWKREGKADKYDNNPYAKFIELEFDEIDSIKEVAEHYIGTRYGHFDCVRGGWYDLTGQQLPDNDLFMDCSEYVTRDLRAKIQNLLPNIEAGCVTPIHLYKEILDKYMDNGKFITPIAS